MATAVLTDPQARERETFARWKAELDFAQKDPKYVEWLARSEKIVKRYRDERNEADQLRRKMNILWSNVQTLMPAVYGKMPKPIVERRFMDRDPAARLASTILERVCSFQMEVGYYNQSVNKSVLDYLLPGMGQTWLRYEPQFEASEEAYENERVESEVKAESPNQTAEDIQEEGDGVAYDKLAYERVCVDYVHYTDFLWGSARCWQEVPWVGRRSWQTHTEIAEKFYGGDLAKAKRITLDYTPQRMRNGDGTFAEGSLSYFKKAEIWEIWNKADRTVYFIAPGTPGVVLKETKDPVLKLEGFWPCPEPLFTTLTNDSLIPVPDYVEYQDQAQEIDDLTNRISKITTAIRANGVYDASVPALQRLLLEGTDNKLIPVDSWAAFAEKGGMVGSVDLLPMKEIAEVLIRLYEARAQVKNDLDQVTGMSDIVRGQSSGGAKTATEQRIKGQYAALRLQDRQDRVAEFCRSTLRIMAEIVSEMFSPESLMQMSGVDQMMADAVQKAVAKVKPPQMPPEMQQQLQGAPPEVQQQAQAALQQQFQQAQQQAAMQAQQEEQAKFDKALEILRSDKLRGFRVDIETDSTLQADAEADKAASTELFGTTMQGINAIAPILAVAPELVDPIGDMLLFTFRRFRVGRSMESGLEDALTKVKERLEEQAANPQPSPEQQAAQAEMQKQQMETQRAQEEHQMDMQAKQAEFQLEQQKAQMELEMERDRNAMEMEKMRAEIEFDREKLGLEREKLGMEAIAAQQQAQVKAEETAMQLGASREQHSLDLDAQQQKHQLGLETMEAKARAAQQQAKAKPNGAGK
jgi:hypothetical protein